ncbi:MFS transporter [Actinocorallia sp. A-T 12471]|uniref:MFS transporter n=1 Tax=Actinocorallia sp. A-T 12471 TaxID=3089813 RepID=UPI0029CC9171|nr:MFS transporter [Actinocorallia sp. A-T 12471]MDX6742007.1 MFS transporter [Actinocorallia sp. A-T 12471]
MTTDVGELPKTNWGAVLVLALATLAAASEVSLSSFTLPLIAAEFGVAPGATAWVLLAYTLPSAALALPAGRWVDGADLRRVYLLGLAGIGGLSVLGVLAPNLPSLLAARVLLGLVSVVFMACTTPALVRAVRPEERGRAMGWLMAVMTLGATGAAPLGGWVAAEFGWRAVFLIKMPLLVVVMAAGARLLRRGDGRLPLPGRGLLVEGVVLGGAMTALVLSVELLDTGLVAATVVLAAAVALGVVWARLRASRPVVAVLRSAAAGLPALVLALFAVSTGLTSFVLPYFVADVMGADPGLLGTAVLCWVGVMSLVTPVAGGLVDRVGALPVAVVGSALVGAGILLHLPLDADAGLADLAWRLALLGLGAGLLNPAVTTAVLRSVPDEQAGVAGGLTTTARTVGLVLAPAVSAAAWSAVGFHGAVGLLAGIAGAAFAVAVAAAVTGRRTRSSD